MKTRVVIAVAVVLVATLVVGAIVGRKTIPAPRVRVDGEVADFGEVSSTAAVTNAWTLYNTGRGTLTINHALTDCSCIRLSLGTNTVSPRSSTTLTAIFRLGGRTGKLKKSVRVITNDPHKLTTYLYMVGSAKDSPTE